MNINSMLSVLALLSLSKVGAMQAPAITKDPLNANRVNLFAHALCWNAREGSLDYMIQNNTGATFINSGNVARVNFDWSGGFRVGLGYTRASCPAAFSLYYTHFTPSGSSTLSTTFPTVLFPVWSNPQTTVVTEQNATAKIHASFNIIDAQVSSLFCPNSCLTLIPVMGLRGARINQKFTINANGGQSLGPVASVLDDAIIMHNHFSGCGPVAGIKGSWKLGCNVSLIGTTDCALLSGKFSVKQQEIITFSNNVPATTFLDIQRNHTRLICPNINLSLGLQWCLEVCPGSRELYFAACWEQQYFFAQNQLMRFTDSANPGINVVGQGDLATQGITIAASCSF